MQDPDANLELVPLILNSIENWDTEIQCLLAESLTKAIQSKSALEPSNINKAIGLALEYVDNLNSETLYSSWRATFPNLAYRLNFVPKNETKQNRQINIL
jgi:hypothetical protein